MEEIHLAVTPGLRGLANECRRLVIMFKGKDVCRLVHPPRHARHLESSIPF